jgi:hypothetical protein
MRVFLPEFAARFELGGGAVSGRLIPDLFADGRRLVKLGTNPVQPTYLLRRWLCVFRRCDTTSCTLRSRVSFLDTYFSFSFSL